MKLVTLTAADVEKLKQPAKTGKGSAPALHHEELTVDGVNIGLARPDGSSDPRTNRYSIAFGRDGTEYQIIIRPTVHETPSVTLNIIRKGSGEAGAAEFASYTVLKDTVTTVKGEVLGLPSAREGVTGEAALANFNLQTLLDLLRVR